MAEQAGLCRTLSETPKTGFFMMWPIWWSRPRYHSLCMSDLVVKGCRFYHQPQHTNVVKNGSNSWLGVRAAIPGLVLGQLLPVSPGVVARSDACPPGMRTVGGSILTSGKTFFH